MAPAAQYRETLLTITTTKAAVVIGALDSTNNAKEVFPTPKATPTHQCTSMFKWPSATPGITPGLRFPIPQIQGIIPGMRRALQGIDIAPSSLSHSPTPSHDTASRPTTKPTSTATAPPPHFSTYPYVSPPGFLYPESIIPHTAFPTQYTNLLQHPDLIARNEHPYPRSIMGRVDYELAYLPTGYKLLFVGMLAVLVLGCVWTVMVWAVHMRIAAVMASRRTKNKKTVGNMGRERRPVDKVSKYAYRHGGQSAIKVDATMDSDSAVTSAAQVPFSYLGNNSHVGEVIEMKYRPQHTKPHHSRPQSRTLAPELRVRTHTPHDRIPSSPSTVPRSSHRPTPTLFVPISPTLSPSANSSPLNPFLDPPPNGLLSPSTSATLVKRSSLEWQAERATFFAAKNTTLAPVSRSGSVSPVSNHTRDHSSASFELNVSDMEALEAGTAPLTGRQYNPSDQRAHSGSSLPSSGSGVGLVQRSRSFIDQGIVLVDGVVDNLAARLGRWADDDGGDEALLLPVARQARRRGAVASG